MLIKVTNQCGAGCSHCMENSTPKSGQHMTMETFDKALDLTARVERLAWKMGANPLILLSGGECTEHPEIVAMVEKVERRGWMPMLISNGYWLADKVLVEALLPPGRAIFVQVTHDPRFYPKAPPPKTSDPRVGFVAALTALLPLGRAKHKEGIATRGVPLKNAPSSFNLRSITRGTQSIEKAIAMLRLRAAMGNSGNCIPSISFEGNVIAGETRSCFKIGTVDSSNAELTEALIAMRCNECGLVDNLTREQKMAIGEYDQAIESQQP